MPARRKSTATSARTRISVPARGRSAREKTRTKRASARRWRRKVRPDILRAVVADTKSLRWTSRLLELLVEELYVGDRLEELMESRVQRLRKRQYPQAVAVALVLRHSWLPDDLDCMLHQLGLRRGRRSLRSIHDARRNR
jgi:hypothetical protein